jgi:hypothetical protein
VRQFVSLAKSWLQLKHQEKMTKMKIITKLAGGEKREMSLAELEELSKHLQLEIEWYCI